MNRKRTPKTVPSRRKRSPTRSAGILVDSDALSLHLWNINRTYCRLLHRFSWQDPDPLPEEGPGILVCNHRSSVDPFILAATTRRVISFLVAREYYQIPGLRWLLDWMRCIPVRRDRRDIGAVRKGMAELRQGRLLCIFPEGGISQGFDDPRLGMGYLSLKSGTPVIPASVSGTPSSDSVWKALFTPSSSSVCFGPVCQPPSQGGVKVDRDQVVEWTARVMRAVTELMP